MSVSIRNATENDLPSIVSIYNDIVENTYAVWNEATVDIENRRAWMRTRKEQGYPILIAELNSEVVGYATYGPFRVNDGYRHTAEGSIYVDRNHRRKGIGRTLLEALINEARKQNIHVLVGGIDGSNTSSIALFESFGFNIVGRMPEVGIKFGKWLDLVLMQKIL
uniref:N-acetyltransferase domain-containing protein n=1 Tax=Acrobeloides nanus TaxID=290746 RepID=A0A914BYE3_9BILA